MLSSLESARLVPWSDISLLNSTFTTTNLSQSTTPIQGQDSPSSTITVLSTIIVFIGKVPVKDQDSKVLTPAFISVRSIQLDNLTLSKTEVKGSEIYYAR